MIEGRVGWWTNLSTSAQWTIILAAAVVALLITIILATTKPWESQQYKDCMAGVQNELGREPGYSQSSIETLCHTMNP